MKNLLLIVVVVLNFGFFFSDVARGKEKIEIADNPLKASTAFIVGLSSNQELKIVEKIKTSQKLPWRNVEKKVKELSGTYRKALIDSGKGARLLVCVFEYEDMSISTSIYRHYFVHGDKIFLPGGKKLLISELSRLSKPPDN